MKLKRYFPLAALGAALGLGATGQAHAYAYAYADLHLYNFELTVLAPNSTSPTTFQTCLVNGCALLAAPASTSSSASAPGGIGDIDALDATISTTSAVSPGENVFTATGNTVSQYAWGDSVIFTEQVLGTPPFNDDGTPNITQPIESRQAAEANSTSPQIYGGDGTTTSTTELTTAITILGDGGRIRFDFDAAILRIAEMTLPNLDEQANSSTSFEISIVDKSLPQGAPAVVSWFAGLETAFGTVGAASIKNAFVLTGQNSVVNPGTAGTGGVLSSGTPGVYIPWTQGFSFITNNLTAGTYDVVLRVNAKVEVEADQPTQVPEPFTLALLGVGLAGMGVATRRRKPRAA